MEADPGIQSILDQIFKAIQSGDPAVIFLAVLAVLYPIIVFAQTVLPSRATNRYLDTLLYAMNLVAGNFGRAGNADDPEEVQANKRNRTL